ncbi:MAG: hypothetical protein RLZZ306_3068 [Bacteroidota bacterium]|jgi:hypothetical protein
MGNNKIIIIRYLTATQWVAGIIILLHLVGLFLLFGSGHILTDKKALLFFRNIVVLLAIIVLIHFIKKRIVKNS